MAPLAAVALVHASGAPASPDAISHATRVAAGTPPWVQSGGVPRPLVFERNDGQIDPSVHFYGRAAGYTLFLTDAGMVLTVPVSDGPSAVASDRVVRLNWTGQRKAARLAGLERQDAVSHYLVGNDRSRWRRNVPQFARVRYEGLYPGVDADVYGVGASVEYDLRVAPGVDLRTIAIDVDGADRIDVSPDGELVLDVGRERLVQPRPVAWQVRGTEHEAVDVRFVKRSARRIGFEARAFDRSRPLVIDPVLHYSSYLGGSGIELSGCGTIIGGCGARYAAGIAVDRSGVMHVAGETRSVNFPGTGSSANHGGQDLFVARISASGAQLLSATYLGGSNDEDLGRVAVDPSGGIYVSGTTLSTDLPTTGGAFQTVAAGIDSTTPTDLRRDGFVAKLDAAGTTLQYLTYLGSDGDDTIDAIAVDGTGSAYLACTTTSSLFPVTSGAAQTVFGGGRDVVVAKLSPSGSALAYGTFVGGSNTDEGRSIALDVSGAAVVVGQTRSSDFPTTAGVVQTALAGTQDAFVTKISSSGAAFDFSAYFGGTENSPFPYDEDARVAVGPTGDIYLGGSTTASNLPFGAAPVLRSHAGNSDGYIARLNPTATSVVYGTYLGGSDLDLLTAIAVDSAGAAFVTGTFQSSSFPTTVDAWDTTKGGCKDAFVTKLASNGASLAFSSYFGGGSGNCFSNPNIDIGLGIAVDAAGDTYVVGQTNSSSATFPLVAAGGTAFDTTYAAGSDPADAFVVRVSTGLAPSLASATVTPNVGPPTGGTTITISGATNLQVGATVTVGGVAATNVVVTGATSLTAVTPAGTVGAKTVVVTNPSTQSATAAGAFTYATGGNAPPQLSGVSPTLGTTLGGTTVTLTGANFASGATVTFGATVVASTFVAANTLTAVTPAHAAGTIAVRVTNPDAQYSELAAAFTYTADSDNDGLPDIWEVDYGLDPNDATGDNGAAGDPDLDTLTNIEEYQGGTNPKEAVRYFAEGATGLGSQNFKVRLAVANPHASRTANIYFEFLPLGGAPTLYPGPLASNTIQVPPTSRFTLDVETDVPNFSNQQFSTIVHSDVAVVVDRTMTWGATGPWGSHAETGVLKPALQWFFAEGATFNNFKLFYLLQNPGASAANVDVTYVLPSPQQPVVRHCTVPPQTRVNIFVNNELCPSHPETTLASTAVSAIFEVTNGQPIIVERAMYQSPGFEFYAGHASAGVTATSTNWFLAEGATGTYFNTFILLTNPTPAAATLEMKLLRQNSTPVWATRVGGGFDSSPAPASFTLGANSRDTVWLNLIPATASTSVSSVVQVTNGVGVLAERAMWWPGLSQPWAEAHNSFGTVATGTKWAMADGEAGGPYNTDTFVLVANTAASAGRFRVTLLFDDGSAPAALERNILASERQTVWVNADTFRDTVSGLPVTVTGRKFGIIVESIVGGGAVTPAPIVVERAMYSTDGQPASFAPYWPAGTNVVATRLQ